MKLEWTKPDDYHIASTCGRFLVARISTSPYDWYTAYCKPFDGPSREIGATRLPNTASEDERRRAIHAMQELCEGECEVGGGTA